MTDNNLLIVEDDPFHRKFLQDHLSGEEFSRLNAHAFATGEDAIDWLEHNHAAYAVIDLQLSGKNGVEVARRAWQAHSESAIVFWSNFSDPAYVRAIAKIVPPDGNFGYLLKTTSPKKLTRSLQGVFFDRQRVVDVEVQGLIKRRHSRSTDLSAVETEVLNLVALGLIDKAISKQTGMSARSVQSIISNIHDKLLTYDEALLQEEQTLNRRCRLVALAVLNGEINRDSLNDYETRRIQDQTQ